MNRTKKLRKNHLLTLMVHLILGHQMTAFVPRARGVVRRKNPNEQIRESDIQPDDLVEVYVGGDSGWERGRIFRFLRSTQNWWIAFENGDYEVPFSAESWRWPI